MHGRVEPDAHPLLAALWADADGPRGSARVERRGADVVVIAAISAPIEADVEVVLGLPDDLAAGLERRPTAMVMIYPDD